MAYNKTTWSDLPSQTTPVNATNLNNMENGIEYNDQRLNGEKLIDNVIYVSDIKGKNLLSNANLRSGIYSITNGAYAEGSTSCCTLNKIEIDNTKNYVLSTGNTQISSYMYIMYYDANGTYLGYISTPFATGLLKFNTYSNYANAKYVNFRFDVTLANLINPQLELGSEPTTYTPYKNFENDITEDFENQVTFNETRGSFNQFKKIGNTVIINYQGQNKAHSVNEVLMTIPVGYRPSQSVLIPFTSFSSAYGQIAITTDGNVTILQISSTSSSGRIGFGVTYTIN